MCAIGSVRRRGTVTRITDQNASNRNLTGAREVLIYLKKKLRSFHSHSPPLLPLPERGFRSGSKKASKRGWDKF